MAEPVPQVLHRLVVAAGHPDRVLVVEEGGVVRLPWFVHDDKHTADVDYINATVRARYGLASRVLQSLSHSPEGGETIERAHALEIETAAMPGRGVRWSNGVDEIADPGDRAALRRWSAAAASPVRDGREWTQPGWLQEVSRWLERTLASAGYGTLRSIVQLRAWASSSVLRVHTDRGDCYFKAVASSTARECTVTDYLAVRFAEVLPRVVAVHPERRWLLTAAFRGEPLDNIADSNVWVQAAARYGRLQVECAPRVTELAALGCETRSLDVLATNAVALASNIERSGGEALTPSEHERLHVLVAGLPQRCKRLVAAGIPLSVEHGDLWPANVLVAGDACAIIDWEDVAIAHPFLSLAPLLVGLSHVATESRTLDSVVRGYLTAFARFGTPEQLADAIQLAAPLSFLDMAVRYRQQRRSVASQHPWMRDMVPEALRRALTVAQLE